MSDELLSTAFGVKANAITNLRMSMTQYPLIRPLSEPVAPSGGVGLAFCPVGGILWASFYGGTCRNCLSLMCRHALVASLNV